MSKQSVIHLTIAKADTTGVPVPDTVIAITAALPEIDNLDVMRNYYAVQALDIERALHHALPGGTYDALLVKMLERTVSLLRVPA